MYKRILLLLPITLLVACEPKTENTDAMEQADKNVKTIIIDTEDAMMEDEKMMDNSVMDDEKMMKQSSYTDMSASLLPETILGDGQVKVLFFHASWCPTCKAADNMLSSLYSTNSTLLSTYKINYDTESVLKQKFGVTSQHTFVKVDEAGQVVEVLQGPDNATLTAFLQV